MKRWQAAGAGRAIEPRNLTQPECRGCHMGRRQHPPSRFGEARRGSAGSENHGTCRSSPPGPGRSSGRPAVVRGRNAKEVSVSRDERSEEIRFGHSSDESGEQGPFGACGAGGAKGRTQGESGKPKLAPCAETGKRVTGGRPDTTGCKEEPGRASCCAPAPRHGARAVGSVPLAQE